MVRHLQMLATSLLTAIGFSLPTEQERMQANMLIFCASILVAFVNAKLDLYFFNKIMTGSHLERQLAKIYVQSVMVLYAGLVLTSWFLFKETLVNPFYLPPDIFMRWVIECMDEAIADSSYVLHVVAAFSVFFRIFLPLLRVAGRRGREWL
jgi:hypothetical protein